MGFIYAIRIKSLIITDKDKLRLKYQIIQMLATNNIITSCNRCQPQQQSTI